MNEDQKSFIRGAGCAISVFVQCNGLANSDAIEAFKATIGSWDNFLSSEPDPHDINILKPFFKPKP